MKEKPKKPSLSDSALKRFWEKIQKGDACWLWTDWLNHDGYGQFWLNGKFFKPHRVMLLLKRGVSLDSYGSLTVDHLCRIRHCVNPDHLEIVTMRENLLRGDTFQAHNSMKTHCHKGHLLQGTNLYLKSNGQRNCRKCLAEASRRQHERKKALTLR